MLRHRLSAAQIADAGLKRPLSAHRCGSIFAARAEIFGDLLRLIL
jgi:hypothetical protein